MSEQINEQLSALLDGELPEAELSLLLRQIAKQPSVLQQAYAIQQARVCVQGDTPASLTDALDFSSKIRDAISNEEQPAIKPEYAQENTARAAFSQHDAQDDVANRRLAKAAFTNQQAVSNESRWRPVMGAGIAAAVALLAVNTWQTQDSNPDSLQPDTVSAETNPFENLEVPAQGSLQNSFQAVQNNLQAVAVAPVGVDQEANLSEESDTSSYTVPKFDDLNIDSPFAFNNDFRQVSSTDYLLQNNLAPQSTSKQLSQFAKEQRAIIYKEQVYIDPKTGDIIFTVKPIIK